MKYDENGEFQKGGLACPPNQVETDESRHQNDVIRSNTRFTHDICDRIFYFLSNVHSNFSKNHGFHCFSMVFIGFGIFEDRCACPGDTNIEITGHLCRNVFSRVRKHSNISHSWGSEHFGHPWNSRGPTSSKGGRQDGISSRLSGLKTKRPILHILHSMYYQSNNQDHRARITILGLMWRLWSQNSCR